MRSTATIASAVTNGDCDEDRDAVGSVATTRTKKTITTKLPNEESFSVSLIKARPEPKTFMATWNRLWMDPRPVTVVIREAFASSGGSSTIGQETTDTDTNKDTNTDTNKIPYCLVSDEFVIQKQHRFRISLFPRGRLAAGATANPNPNANAAAYLQYIPNHPGDEVDVGWKLELVDKRTKSTHTSTTSTSTSASTTLALALAISTSGGLPRSNTTWSAAMTFCSEPEALESCGRAADWGSSAWSSKSVCRVLASGCLEARGSVVVYGSRSGETSARLGGALGAALAATADAGKAGSSGDDNINDPEQALRLYERSFKVGEVVVPMADHPNESRLEDSFVTAGTDYRIMTMAAPDDGRPIFSTDEVPPEQRKDVRLALRPCGWKVQQQMWNQQQSQEKQSKSRSQSPSPPEWPVEVPAGWLSTSARSRFNPSAFLPRLGATFQRDSRAVLLGVALALLPLPGALIGRNYVSLYAIPSASMDPTLVRGDVLLAEKFPGVDGRLKRGEIVLFRPPSALEEIAGKAIKSKNGGGSPLFVKRIVGLPGDTDVALDPRTGEVTLNDGLAASGPDRNLCADEPLRLIDRFLETGKGTYLEKLGADDFYVLGDCKAVSIDSRVFGVLPRDKIEGRTLGRIWPLNRVTFGQL